MRVKPQPKTEEYIGEENRPRNENTEQCTDAIENKIGVKTKFLTDQSIKDGFFRIIDEVFFQVVKSIDDIPRHDEKRQSKNFKMNFVIEKDMGVGDTYIK